MIEKIRNKWQEEEYIYKQYGETVKNEIQDILKVAGIYGELSSRTKDVLSLIKKIQHKQKSYDDILDKVGVRVVVQFRRDLYELDKKISEHFKERIKKRDDKKESLSVNTFGYQSIHYDIININNNICCELQIRTICQHNWSMIAHSLSYKNGQNIPVDIERQINALSALFEVADTQFQSILESISILPADHSISVLQFIEKKLFSFGHMDYNREMTNYFLEKLELFYQDENIIEKLETFYQENSKRFNDKFHLLGDKNIFYTQPEILIILERLTNKKLLFNEYWCKNLHSQDLLEEIANIWGITLE